jgi:hypothetical protein
MGGAGRQRESGGAWRERGRAQMGHVGRERREGSAGARERERGGKAWAGSAPAARREKGFSFFFFFYFLFLNPFSPINKYSSKFLGCQNEILYVKCH